MLFVSVGLFVHGWHYFGGQPLAALESVGSDYAAVHPSSNLYFSMFSVYQRFHHYLCADAATSHFDQSAVLEG